MPTKRADEIEQTNGHADPPEARSGQEGTSPADAPAPTDESPGTATGRRRIGIVGYTGHREDAPFHDSSWELWGMNNLWKYMPPGGDRPSGKGKYRWDAWFEVHPYREIVEDPEQVAWLQQPHDFPVFMMLDAIERIVSDIDPDARQHQSNDGERWWKKVLPSAEPFPLADLLAKFQVAYFTSTPSWQVALAVMLLANWPGAEIGLWGVDMAVGTEYSYQRPSVEYYLGIAAGAGISITVPAQSDLLKSAQVYGGQDNPLMERIRFRVAEMTSKLEEVMREKYQTHERFEALGAAELQLRGAIEQLNYFVGTWSTPSIKNRDARIDPLTQTADQAIGKGGGGA